MDRLFVYGTLRSGSLNHYAVQLARQARLLGTGTVAGRLYRVSHYPALATAELETDQVVGDVFEGVNDALWKLLDDYEGADYIREEIEVTMNNGEKLAACVYRYVLPTHSLERIRSGDWNHPDRIHG